VANDLSSVWGGIKIICGIKCCSLSKQKGSDATKGFLWRLIYFIFWIWVLGTSYYKEEHEMYLPRVDRCSSCQNKTYERHLRTNTFTRITFWVLTLEGRSFRVFLGVSRLRGVSRFFLDIPGLRAIMALFCVRGYKSSLHPFPSLSCPFRPATLRTHSLTLFTLVGLGLVRFVGDLRRDWEKELWEC
jgi:hypothetical protein